jgi:hypothetical protein
LMKEANATGIVIDASGANNLEYEAQ